MYIYYVYVISWQGRGILPTVGRVGSRSPAKDAGPTQSCRQISSIFSSGVFELAGRRGGNADSDTGPTWEQRHAEALKNAELKKDLELLWFATGREDFLVETTRRTVEVLRKHGFRVFYKETEGGHTWINWRAYLNEFAPQLFKPVPPE